VLEVPGELLGSGSSRPEAIPYSAEFPARVQRRFGVAWSVRAITRWRDDDSRDIEPLTKTIGRTGGRFHQRSRGTL